MKTEFWKKIPAFKFYEASTLGRIRSVDKRVKHNYGGVALKRGRVIAQYTDSNGYLACGIQENGKTKTMKVHRLIAMTFIPNPKNKPTVNHKDGDKRLNTPKNLEWATHSENVQHAWNIGLNGKQERTLLQKTAFREACKKPVLCINTLTGKKRKYKTVGNCAKALSVTQSCVSRSLTRGNIIQRTYKIQYR